ncbi:HEAT repeat domain-containing protein [Neorhodopirellula pilleata]|uniref:Uncharacterized protein n=1 Tax=Neorhodopirellula pilleata TaxID=2714738 RepID=A0A5C6A843_9BACT|nr:HEAT repeat domain-containing protein [Neorhodopirellula pilleata]TWT95468.1 hypothetical protein Pla100_31090 [Neorhodopirellula pilleata]
MFSPHPNHEFVDPNASGDQSVSTNATESSRWDADAPNLFSLARDSSQSALTKRMWRGIKTMLAVLLVTSALLGSVYLGKQWLLHQLVAGLDELDTTGKQNRLIQIASFGTAAIEPLAERLVDEQDEISESAFVLLQKMQNDWITLGPDDAIAAHERLVTAIANAYGIHDGEQPLASNLTSRHIARGRELLNQTILEFASLDPNQNATTNRLSGLNQTESTKVGPVEQATRLLDRMRFSDASRSPAFVTTASRRVLPERVSRSDGRSGWTDWPPPQQDRSVRSTPAQIVRSGGKPDSLDEPGPQSDRLQPVPSGVTVPLSEIVSPSRPTKVLAARQPLPTQIADRTPASTPSAVQMATHLAGASLAPSPLTVLDDETVIRHLANPDALVAEQAKTELESRGFTPAQMEMAHAIAVAGPPDRIRLVDSLVHSSQIDSGPWMSMMLDDPDRGVRLHVVSTMAAMLANRQDPGLEQRLRRRLAREQDAHVAKRIRNVLDLR